MAGDRQAAGGVRTRLQGRQNAHLGSRSGSAANSLYTASWLPSFLLCERRGLAPTTSKVPKARILKIMPLRIIPTLRLSCWAEVIIYLLYGSHQASAGWRGPKEGRVLRMQALFLQTKSQRLHRAPSQSCRKGPGYCSPSRSLLQIPGNHWEA